MEFVLALFGVLFLGAAAAPLNPDLAPAEITSRLAAMRAKATIIPGHLYDAFVTAHPAAAGTAWKLTLGSGGTVLHTAAAGSVPAAPTAPPADQATAGDAATWYTAVPTIHQILLVRAASDYPKDHPPRLRFIRTASAALAPAVLSDLQAAFSAPVIPAYGMTETAHQAASNPLPADGPVKPASVGVPTGVQIQVTNPDGSPAPAGVTGEIWIRGAAVTAGYRDNPDANAASFTGGWFHTGDLGYADTDGYLFLRGRIKEIIDRGGENISPAEVDAVLQANPKISDAMSFGVSDAMYGEEINAAVILRPGQSATEEELKQYCLARLSAFEVPKRFFFMTSFPHTVKGADDRHRLAAALGLPSQRGLSLARRSPPGRRRGSRRSPRGLADHPARRVLYHGQRRTGMEHPGGRGHRPGRARQRPEPAGRHGGRRRVLPVLGAIDLDRSATPAAGPFHRAAQRRVRNPQGIRRSRGLTGRSRARHPRHRHRLSRTRIRLPRHTGRNRRGAAIRSRRRR